MRIFGPAVASSFCLLGLVGCGHQQPKQTLDEALFQYVHGIRWSKPGYVTDFLPSTAKLRFVTDQERLQNVRVTHCAPTRVISMGDKLVRVTLRVNWFSLTQGRVQRTLVLQQWKLTKGRWQISDQRLIGGAPLPLFRTITARDRDNSATKKTSARGS
jgi:hypothetical protein